MLHPVRLGLAAGILGGAWMLIFTFIAIWFGYGKDWMILLEGGYPGYTVTPGGSIVGLIYGFVYGFISLWVFGLIYNAFGGSNQ